jgi:hypothetical protein
MASLFGCDEDSGRVLFDLEGPRGQVEVPGPWTVAVLTDGTRPALLVAVDDGEFAARSVAEAGRGHYVGTIDALPVGAFFHYYAKAGAESLPVGSPRTVEVVAPRAPSADAGVGRCTLTFRYPRADQRLTERSDDSAPQAGLQVTVILETDLPDGHPVRLEVEGTAYAEIAGAGQVGFRDVTLASGEVRLRADGRRQGGDCVSEVTVFVSD